MKIYTKTGDQMTTGLLDGTRVSKHDVRIHLLGNIDELNSMLGVVKSLTKNPTQVKEFSAIQRTLMKLMAGIAETPSAPLRSALNDRPLDDQRPPFGRRISCPKDEDATRRGQNAPSIERNAAHLDGAAETNRQAPLITHRKYPIAAEDIAYLEVRIDQMESAFDREKDFVLPGGSFYSAQIDVARTVTRRCERGFAEAAEEYPLDKEAARYLNRLSDYLYVLARYVDTNAPQSEFGEYPTQNVGWPPARDISQRKQGAPSIAGNASHLDGAGAVDAFDSDASDCLKASQAPGTSSFTGMASPERQTCKLTEDIAQAAVDSLHKKFNHSYDTFYTFCVCDAEGRQLATNALEHHSVALSEAQRAAADALARAARKGCSDPRAAANPENGGAALYIYEQLTGSVGVYGAYKKDTNEKAKLLLDALRNMLL